MGRRHSEARRRWAWRGGAWRTSSVVSLAVLVALVALAAGAGAATPGRQTGDDTQILTSEVEGVASLPLLGGEAAVRSPLVVFYEPGTQRLVIPADGLGVLTSAEDAGTVGVTNCDDMTLPPAVRALCLRPAGLESVGTYTGTVRLLAPAANTPGTAEAAETPAGEVKLSVVVQRSLFTFIGLAFLGTLLSHLVAWFAAEYQQIRQLRAECDEFVCRREPKDERYPPFTCKEKDGKSNGLKLVCLGEQIDEGQLRELHQPAVVLWLRSFLGQRPDYDALNESLAAARATRQEFDRLCLQVDVLKKLADEASRLYRQIGGNDEPGLCSVLNEATTFKDQSVPYNEVAKRLKQGGALEALSRRWLRLAEHVRALRCWREDLMVASEAGRPVVVDASFHLTMAQRKLGKVKHNADFGVLRPDLDIQAAWQTLEARRLELLEQQKRELWSSGERPEALAGAMPAWAGGPLLRPSELLSELERIWKKVSVAWARWSPRLNTAALVLLLVLSFLATALVGMQALYLDKPWGTPLDMLILVLLGGGIHAGLTGVAGAVAGSKSNEETG